MNCERALAILRGLEAGQLAAEAHEIEELLAPGLVIEVSPLALDHLRRIASLREHYHEFFHDDGDPLSVAGIRAALADVEGKLRNDWYRLRTSNASLREQEENRVALRRALGAMSDPEMGVLAQRASVDLGRVAPNATWVASPAIGSWVFAISARGRHVGSELYVRATRYAEAPLKAFLGQLEKVEAKMQAFGQDVQGLYEHVGYVRKGKAQVVIGLVKSDLPAAQAASLYSNALGQARAPDVAVTLTRNAKREGGAGNVHQKLGAAYQALLQAGFPQAPIVQGAAKSLLPFDPPSAGVARFTELFRRLQKSGGSGDELYKLTARLMPASGTPAELVQRAAHAAQALSNAHDAVVRRPYALGMVPVALASMARDDASVDAIATRFVDIERALAASRLIPRVEAEGYALECMGCPGTPDEVVATVGALAARVGGATVGNERLAIAAAFAKRFAY